MSVSGCTIAGNSTERGGGGIFVGGGALTIANSTIADNSAEAGGGIDMSDLGGSAKLTVVNSTIAGNDVSGGGGGGGGLFVDANCTATLDNTIAALNTVGTGNSARADDIAGLGSVSGSYNLIGTGGADGLATANHNQLNVTDPGLASGLAFNGGPTETIALLAGSPAIDKGSASITGVTVPDTDQRGFPRTDGNDIGAFQADPVPASAYVNGAWAGDQPGTAVTWTDGSTHYVGYDAFATVQAAVNAVASGGTVNVAAGTYTEQVTITHSLTLTGAGAAGTTIQAPAGLASGDEVAIASGAVVSISGVTVSGAGGSTGIGEDGGMLSATEIAVTGFSTGVAVETDGAATVAESTIARNHNAAAAGGGIVNAGTLTLTDTTITGNSATAGAGIFNNGGTLLAVNCTIADNNAASGGAGAGSMSTRARPPWTTRSSRSTPTARVAARRPTTSPVRSPRSVRST